jgi:hypothetical protein
MTIAHGPSMTTTARPGGRNGMVQPLKNEKYEEKVAKKFAKSCKIIELCVGKPLPAQRCW